MANNSPAELHLSEAAELISSTTVMAIFYTLVFILFCLSFRLSYSQLRDDHGKIKQLTMCTLVFQTVLLICATLDVIVQNRITQVKYIVNSTLPGGPLGLPSALSVATLTQLLYMVNLAENLLILAILLWRVRVVWSGTRFAIPLTIASGSIYLGNAVLEIFSIVINWNINTISVAAQPQAEFIITLTAPVFSLTSQLFMTATIIARILFVRHRHIKLMGRSDVAHQYLGIAAMVIESYALDALWGVGLFTSYGLKYASTHDLFDSCVTQVDILTNFLLIYRVLSGRAWTRQTQDRLSSLRWASNGADTTTSGTVDLRQTSVPSEDPPVISLRNGV